MRLAALVVAVSPPIAAQQQKLAVFGERDDCPDSRLDEASAALFTALRADLREG